MTRNAASCSTWQLYVIVDASAIRHRDLSWVAEEAIAGGADVIQLRDKTAPAKPLIDTAARILTLTRAAQIPLIINDRVEVAAAVGADGLHLGQEDAPLDIARGLLGPSCLLGQSTHSLDQAVAAERAGAHYIAVGPIFSTPTKPDYHRVGTDLLTTVIATVRTPVVAIGGIDQQTLPAVLSAGARCVAVVRAVCGADHPREAAATLKHDLAQFLRITASRSL